MSSFSPQHELNIDIDTVMVKDISNTITQDVNPLIEEDLKKILIESTTQEKLCENPILVSVEEIENTNKEFVGEEIKTQETSTTPPQSTMIQPPLPLVVYQRKEPSMTNISKLVHTMSVPKVSIEAQDTTQVLTI